MLTPPNPHRSVLRSHRSDVGSTKREHAVSVTSASAGLRTTSQVRWLHRPERPWVSRRIWKRTRAPSAGSRTLRSGGRCFCEASPDPAHLPDMPLQAHRSAAFPTRRPARCQLDVGIKDALRLVARSISSAALAFPVSYRFRLRELSLELPGGADQPAMSASDALPIRDAGRCRALRGRQDSRLGSTCGPSAQRSAKVPLPECVVDLRADCPGCSLRQMEFNWRALRRAGMKRSHFPSITSTRVGRFLVTVTLPHWPRPRALAYYRPIA